MRDARMIFNQSLLAVLWILLITIGSCSVNEVPQEYVVPIGSSSLHEVPQEYMWTEEMELTTGVMYILPSDAETDNAKTLSSNTFTNWYRYPAEERTWLVQSNDTAYSRDVLVAGETYISGAEDGEMWSASGVRPDGTPIMWGTVTFHSEYNGKQNCFVTSTWERCNITSIYLIWYQPSQCVEPGQWTMRFFNNGNKFYEGTFKVLPQIPPEKVPLLNQKGNFDHYDDRCWVVGSNRQETIKCDDVNTEKATIDRLGCFLVGSCMILGYHEVSVSPSTLNAWFKDPNNKGYKGYIGGDVNGWAVAKYARDIGGVEVYYAGVDNVGNLVNKVCSRGPQLAYVRKYGEDEYHHFVTVIGENEERTTYKINDPAGGVERLLTDKYQDIGSIRVFEGPEYIFKDSLNGITIHFYSPGELLLKDSQGRRLGIDPLTGQTYDEIPYGSYELVVIEGPDDENSRMESKIIEVMRPVTGEYVLTVTGTGEGTYDLSVLNYDIQGEPSTAELEDIPITTDAVHSYVFDVQNTPGTEIELGGGWDGGGQRPRDVNKFLSYSTVSSSRVEMPAGATSFALMIVYGPTIIPGTFVASLDRTDISGMFSPAPASSEIVNIPLHEGRNVLSVSVKGSVESGRITRDADRIVFLVPAL